MLIPSRHEFPLQLWFVSSGIWALAALLGGLVTAGIYWAILRSTLRSPPEPVIAPEAGSTQV
jgi:hypothetical protein